MNILLALMGLQAAPAMTGTLPAERVRSEEPLSTYVSDSDYPADALARGVEGIVVFRLVVSPEGRVIDCKIEGSSGVASLDAQTCAVMTARARFHPARNRAGQPVIDTIRTRLRWRIGGDLPADISPFMAVRQTLGMRRAPDGEIRCAFEINGVRQPLPDGCLPIYPYLLAIARDLDPALELTVVESFIPQGGIITAPALSYGQLLAESEAELTIGADGEISNCRTLARAEHVGGAPTPPDLCAVRPLPRYLPGASNRHARVRVLLFLGAPTTA